MCVYGEGSALKYETTSIYCVVENFLARISFHYSNVRTRREKVLWGRTRTGGGCLNCAYVCIKNVEMERESERKKIGGSLRLLTNVLVMTLKKPF